MARQAALYVGLMSGTSVDAIDSALVGCSQGNIDLLATHQHDLPASTKAAIAALSQSGPDEIERMGPLDRELGLLFAEAALELLSGAGRSPAEVSAIGSHGQTIRHRPVCGDTSAAGSFTLQLGDPNTIAEITGITTVADFRRRDIAAGGQGAPLAPAFHAAAFARQGVNRAIVNIGGIANATLLEGMQLRSGFDTGPGNTLLDHWIRRHQDQAFDQDGAWSAQGRPVPGLLDALLGHSYFSRSGPRSTGKETFNLHWLDDTLTAFEPLPAAAVQATLAELTAASIALAIERSGLAVTEVYACGGGAHNDDLMGRLARLLAPAKVTTTAELGIGPDWVEAITFAWLARQTMENLAGNAPAVTGARGPRVLGGMYPGWAAT